MKRKSSTLPAVLLWTTLPPLIAGLAVPEAAGADNAPEPSPVLRAVRRVQILVGGRPVTTLAGHVDLTRPLSADMTLIAEPRPEALPAAEPVPGDQAPPSP